MVCLTLSSSLPTEFFVNPKCPPIPVATEDTTVRAHPIDAAKEPEENASVGD